MKAAMSTVTRTTYYIWPHYIQPSRSAWDCLIGPGKFSVDLEKCSENLEQLSHLAGPSQTVSRDFVNFV